MLSEEFLRQIAEAGKWSPTGMGYQKPFILAVTNREMRDCISKLNAEIMGVKSDPFYGASAMFIALFVKIIKLLLIMTDV